MARRLALSSKTWVGYTPSMGRGVFADQNFNAGQLIEVAPILRFDGDAKLVRDMELSWYRFGFYDSKGWCIALGNGSLYNHSDDPNVSWTTNKQNCTITFKAVRDILVNSQLFIDYGWPEKYYYWR